MTARDKDLAPSIGRILFPSDLSRESERAFTHARLLASRFGSHLTLYHALEIPGDRWIRAAGREEELRLTVAGEARAALEALARGLSTPHDVVVDTDVAAAAVLADISLLRQIEALKPDLVVMASNRRGGLGTFFLGSVAQEVLRQARCPVLVVGPRCGLPAAGYRRIVVPTDLSEASRRAFPLAAMLASRFDASIVAVHVVARPLLVAQAGNPHALAAAVPSTAALRTFVDTLDHRRVTPRVEQGAPWERIVSVARDEGADLVVMAMQGADSLGERLLGSQTERVVRHAGCPVLVV